jgi:hypothetical protein
MSIGDVEHFFEQLRVFVVGQHSSNSCETIADDPYDDIIIPGIATISIFCSMHLIYLYYVVNLPILKRHPTSKSVGFVTLTDMYRQMFQLFSNWSKS